MGSKHAFGWACLLTSLMVLVTGVRGQVKLFNLMDYGAVADGATENSEVIFHMTLLLRSYGGQWRT
jgi:hypothetical protein